MSTVSRGRWLSPIYALTIFVSAFLLFQVQPIISKAILPWFGGSPAVWTTAMLFFQTLLFFGYAYAHFSQSLRRPLQVGVHLMLLVAAVAMLPILPGGHWKPADGSDPAGRILFLLAANVGLPYFVLSTTGPLVQTWFSRTNPGRSPYRLYSLSNIGSLLALLTYPFVVEPAATLGTQARCWQAGFWLFAALCGYGAWRAATSRPEPARQTPPSGKAELPVQADAAGLVTADDVPAAANASAKPSPKPSAGSPQGPGEPEPVHGWGVRLLWLLLPAFASTALLATTNHVCQDVAVIPFLWVVPLSLYLLTFIICFDHQRWYWPRLLATAMFFIFLAGALYGFQSNIQQYVGVHYQKFVDAHPNSVPAFFTDRHYYRLPVDVTLCFAGLFCLCMLCHGELVRLKPHPRHLTMFYLLVAAGGAVGGLFVSLVAPHVFVRYTEWNITLLGGFLLMAAILLGTGPRGLFRRHFKIFVPGLALLGCLMYVGAANKLNANASVITTRRNFYGVLTVATSDDNTCTELYNGRILHGLQFPDEPLRSEPTTYYGRDSGVGRAINYLESLGNVRVGAIGLGTGTLAAYARANDDFTFYEINPEVRDLAGENGTYFTYIADALNRVAKGTGAVQIVMGDARLSLEHELLVDDAPAPRFDLLVVDAFSGDAIPTHLLTGEAGDLYQRRLAPDGALAIHISNHYLDLDPVVRGLAGYLKLATLRIHSEDDDAKGINRADWVLLTRNQKLLAALRPAQTDETDPLPPLLWTDDYSDLYRILK